MANDTAATTTDAADPTNREILDPETLEPRKKPVNDAGEALALAKRYFQDREKANENHGVVRLKFDGEPPYKVGAFASQGQGWRANTSRKSMSGAVQRSVPVLIQFLDGLRYLTASRLPDTIAKRQAEAQKAGVAPTAAVPALRTPGAPTGDDDSADDAFATPTPVPMPSPQEKSEIFQRAITSLLRGWNGFRPFMYQVGNEDVLFGHLAAGCLDDVEWRPQAFSFDRFAIDGDSSHDIKDCEAVAFRKNFAIHELIGFIQDRNAAKDAGWNVENVVEAINNSLPDDKRRDANYSRTKLYADMIRDGNLAQSIHANAKSVECYVVPYREYEGKVSQYIVARTAKTDQEELFYSEGRFERMADVCALFSLQEGNGKFYGSIGVGREVFGPHLARDRNFCKIADLSYLMGLIPLPDEKGSTANNAAFKMDGVFAWIKTSADNIKNARPIMGNVELLLEVDKFYEAAIEQLSNAYLPSSAAVSGPGGEKSTATEIIENARRIDMLTGDRLARFYGQFCALIEMIQRRVCSTENIKAAVDFYEKEQSGKTLLSPEDYAFYEEMRDKEEASDYEEYELPAHLDRDAVMLCVDLLREGLTPLDIRILSRAPANEPMGETPATINQKILQGYPMFNANPGVNQPRLLKLALAAAFTPQIAEELFLAVGNQSAQPLAEAQKQLIELGTMAITGKPVDVLPTDDDAVHRAKLKELFAEGAQQPEAIAANPQAHNALTLALAHYNAHLAQGKQKGEKGEGFAADVDTGAHVGAVLHKADEIVAKQSAAAGGQPALPAPPPQ